MTLMPLALFGCNGGGEPTDTEVPTRAPTEKPKETEEKIMGTPISLKENIDKLKLHGRYTVTDSGIACDFVASGIEFTGVMKGEVYLEIKSSAEAYFTVYVDGYRRAKRYEVGGGRFAENIKIADFGDSEAEHTVKVLKQTESRYAISEFRTLTVQGELSAPPAYRDTYIEFIGDSLTCGMGNLGDNSIVSNAQTAKYEDGTHSYGFLAAEALGADHSIISQSGIGIAGSWFDPIGDYYTRLSYSRDRETAYGFERVPDLVVINLGTNDYYLNKDKDPAICTPEQVQQKTVELIELVRSSYGEQVPIVWAYDFVGECRYDAVKAAIDSLGGEEASIYTCKLPQNRGGAQWHPDKSGHSAAAEVLEDFIREKFNLEKENEK